MSALATQPTYAAPSPTDARGLVSAEDFSFWYGEKKALKGISLTAHPRSVTALIGPSGCGKSTFLRSINRMNALLPGIKHEGTIRLDDTDIFCKSMDLVVQRRRVGIVFKR